MATVMGGVGYGLYFTAKRYILPLISPPTPPQLEQDKTSIDESFKRAFDLIEQLNTDTSALKASEEARTAKLDTAVGEVESVLSTLKELSKRQSDDNRRLEDDVRGLRDLIPKALDAQKEATDARLKELSTELKSLKTLVGNRMGANAAPRPAAATPGYYGLGQSQPATPSVNTTPAIPTPSPQPAATEASNDQAKAPATNDTQAASSSAASTPATENKPSTPYSRLANGRAAIPAWQMAAAKKNEEAKKDTSESGTVADASSSS
jgi:peroxin-14